MILSDDTSAAIDDYRVRMLISNKIPFILKCNIRKFDQAVKYYYEITSKHPMNRVFEKKKIGMSELNDIITSLMKVLESSMEYLLNPNDFILDSEYIYMNIETNQVYFCYMPGYETDISKSFNELTAYLLEKIDHDDKHAVATAYELYRQTLNDNYSLNEILNTINDDNQDTEFEKTQQLTTEENAINEHRSFEYKKEEEENASKSEYHIKPVYIFGGIVIAVAISFLIYYLYTNTEVIKNIKIDSDLAMKIGGGALIVGVLILYAFIKKYQARKEEQENEDILVITEENEELPIKSKGFEKKEVFSKIIQKNKKDANKSKRESNKREFDREITTYTSSNVNNKITKNNHFELSDTVIQTKFNENNQTETYGNTVLLAYRVTNKKLIATREIYQNFDITSKSFLIGKIKEHVDGIINDDMISRIHAEIKNDNGKYFLIDLNSTNGTFHNGRRLEANEMVEIKEEDMIRFATAEYIFR